MLTTATDHDLRGFVGQPIIALKFLNDGLLQLGDTAGWSVFGEFILQGLDGGSLMG